MYNYIFKSITILTFYEILSNHINIYPRPIFKKSFQNFTLNEKLTKFVCILNETIHIFDVITQILGLSNALKKEN